MNGRTRKKQERAQQKRRDALQETADLLLSRLTDGIAGAESSDFTAMKNAAAVLKDLKAVQMIEPDGDLREQEVRIAGLLRKLELPEQSDGSLRVVLSPEAEEWSE